MTVIEALGMIRKAIAQDDPAAVSKALDEAERLAAIAPEIAVHLRGGEIVEVSRANDAPYVLHIHDPRNSSLECSKCGTLSRKEVYDLHSCPACGLVLHRDHNAAIVIRDRGMKILGRGHRPRRGARPTGAMEDAGRHRHSAPEKTGTQRRDDVANRTASGGLA